MIFSFLKLIRYKNLVMVALTMFLTKYALIHSYMITSLSNIEFLILLSSVLFITAGGYIINDVYDIEADKINKPEKVIVSKSISSNHAWKYYYLLSISGLSLGIYISFEKQLALFSLYFIASFILLFLYSRFLKKIPLLGNLVISLLVTLTIFLVYEFHSKLVTKSNMINDFFLFIVIFYYLLFAFLTTFIREIIKDIEDIKGDYNLRMKTLPILLGIRRTRDIAIVLSMILLLFLISLLKETYNSRTYLLLSILSIGIIIVFHMLYKLWSANSKKQFQYLSNLMKIIMFLGILSMGFFKFI